MPLSFPASPTSGDTYTYGTRTWQFDGSSWNLLLGTSSISDGSVSEGKLVSGAVTESKIASDAVTAAKIADDAVEAAHVSDGAITANHIASNAVTSAKIADGAITSQKLAAGAASISSLDDIGNVTISSLQNNDFLKWDGTAWVNAVNTPPDGSVTSGKIAGEAVNGDAIKPGAVTESKLDSQIGFITVCTSQTLPQNPFTGKTVFETDTNKMRVWLGSAWSAGTVHSSTDGLTEATAAPSASWLVQNLSVTTSGYYWIKPTGFATARQVWCDMTNSGGGWMLMSFTGADNTTGSHVTDGYSGSDFNMGSTATSIISTSQSSGTAGNLGQSFINQLVTNGRGNGVALFRVDNTNWYFTVTSTASWLPIDSRRTTVVGNRTLTGNDWLKTCYTGYSTGNAGNVSGTSYVAGSAYWNTYPGNFDTHTSNWGYSIDPYYSGANGNAWATSGWSSCHSSGWNKAGSFWLKIGA